MSARLPLSDIQFISDFAAFCRTKPAGEEYFFFSAGACALAEFGHPGVQSDNLRGVPYKALHAAAEEPRTYPALADRLEALIADAPAVRCQS